ncbi:hypothetical protein [Scleromatobacter humisilvae]|uniref:Uncharacterized protein n=1 Tax=Scleromatobacter humisilvae TaxID=2897159 RepID=A0A9X1YM72_9BURK|nr:hypothetical protein [Scleromatobacter humisilvae]MCK9686947.1 hypothetical protein [Scleromatobacter humisilvae]
MTMKNPSSRLVLALLLCGAAGVAHADGLADLRGALARLQGQAPLKASVQVRDWRRTGDGKDAKETQGQATIGLEDGPRGLQPLYGHELLARLDAESRAAVKDKSAKKPLSVVMSQLELDELRAMASAAPALQRAIDDAQFKSESADTLAGKPARRLVFEGSVDSLSESDRKYVRDMKLQLTLWIAADGTPLASQRHFDLSGRAFVVVSFEQHSDEQRGYAVVGDRLVATSDDEKGNAKGAGEAQEYHTERSLQVLP